MARPAAHLASFVFACCLLTAGRASGNPAPTTLPPDQALAQVTASALDGKAAYQLGRLKLAVGTLTLEVESGTVFAASPVAGRSVEFVFLGKAKLLLEPPDAIERGQLELFAGRTRLAEPIESAVFAIANDAAAQALTRKPAEPTPADRERAKSLYAAWRASAERKILDVDAALLRDALADRVYQGFFAGWFDTVELGRLVYSVEPDAEEQVTLGQFVPADLTAKEKKKVERRLHKEQHRGRLIGLDLDDLGQFDTWISTSLRRTTGEAAPGYAAFEPRRYVLELTLSDSDFLANRGLEATGRARIQLESVMEGARFVELGLYPELKIDRILSASGEPLFFVSGRGDALVALPEGLAAGATTSLEIEYHGKLLDKVDTGEYALADSIQWHPRVGSLDRATYDVTLRWPQKLELVASGKRVEGGKADGLRWERRTVDLPCAAFGFEVGRFSFETRKVGHVELRLALSPVDYGNRKRWHELVLDTGAEALAYFEEVFGPYPLDELTLATSPRLYSQSLLGLVSLSSTMMDSNTLTGFLLGFEDPRTIIAHEIAHQWWGHQVGWEGYRDQWLSEAMANYAASEYALAKVEDGLRWGVGPTSYWQNAMTRATLDGRMVESVGPLALGQRLSSSRAEGAYESIVYKKGAVVLETLSRHVGKEAFHAALKQVVAVAAHREVSTATFFELLERSTGSDLDAFQERFVLATGLPDVYYTYRFEPAETAGKWRVVGRAETNWVAGLRHRIVEREGGRLDVTREALTVRPPGDAPMVAPFEIAVYDPKQTAAERKLSKKLDPKEVGNTRIEGRLWLTGDATDFDFTVDLEPKEFWLDGRKRVFGRFINEHRTPKRALFYRALDHLVLGRHTEAEQACRQSIAAPSFVGPAYDDTSDEDDWREEAKLSDGRCHLLFARLHLDAGRAQEAEDALEVAEKLAKPRENEWLEGSFRIARARLHLLRNEAPKVVKLFEDRVLQKDRSDDPEELLLYAIACQATGKQAELPKIAKAARKIRADLGPLTPTS